MAADDIKAWQLGSPGTLSYRFYDWLRVRLNHKLVRYLASEALSRDGAVVLEAGSGPAFASSILAAHPKVGLSVALDIDMDALREARKRDPALALVVGDLCHLPFRRESVDLAWNSSTIEHLPDPQVALAEMHRVTRARGRVFAGVPYLFGPLGFQRLISKTSAGVWIGETFSRHQLEGMMRSAGLTPIGSILYFFRFFLGMLGSKGYSGAP